MNKLFKSIIIIGLCLFFNYQLTSPSTFKFLITKDELHSKWETVMERTSKNSQSWNLRTPENIKSLKTYNIDIMDDIVLVQFTNELVNREPYVSDYKNWDVADYWETPEEFFKKGGDCEDQALTKYFILKASGIDPKNMELLIVYVPEINLYHAILKVNYQGIEIYLDNSSNELLAINPYVLIYSVNDYKIQTY